MFLLLVIGACGAWCAHQHWMRLDQEESLWRQSFWNWVLRGFAFPLLVWSVMNFGFGDRFPPLVPNLADAQNSNLPWFGKWVGVCFAGAILISTWWAAVTYSWIVGKMASQAKNKTEFAFNVGVFGLFTGACGAALAYLSGPLYFGASIVVLLLPIVYLTLDLAEKPPARPAYDRAIGQMKMGKYANAEWEVISQLEKRDNDFEGWMMLAELYANQRRNIEDAARVILDICKDPKSQAVEISVACHKLADWQMEIAENPEGARAALELLCRKLPETHFAKMAQQRMRQLPRSAEELEESKKPKRIQLPSLREDSDESQPEVRPSTAMASLEANRLVERLTEDPDDFPAREKLAATLAVDLGKVDLGIEQLRLLIEVPEALDEQRAKWLAQVGAWELKLKHNEEKFRETLREIIRKFPQTSQAFAAQRRLFLLDQERPAAVASKVA